MEDVPRRLSCPIADRTTCKGRRALLQAALSAISATLKDRYPTRKNSTLCPALTARLSHDGI